MGQDISDFIEAWHDATDSIVAHTSGSTGKPKEIRLRKSDMLVSAKATCAFFGIDSTSHLVMPLSVSYIAGKMMVVRSLVSGARLSELPATRTLAGLESIEGTIDLLPIVPSQIEGLLDSKVLHNIRNVIIGGAPMTEVQEAEIASVRINAYATYGMTETCSHVALRHIGYDTSFEAMAGISFDVDDDDCLIINAPLYTSKRFLTNDIVELIDERHFRWLGRRDNVINSGGIKIIPEHVEDLLRRYIGEYDYYITSRKSERWGEEAILVVEDTNTEDDLLRRIQSLLAEARKDTPHHLIPKDIVVVSQITHTSNGKIKRARY